MSNRIGPNSPLRRPRSPEIYRPRRGGKLSIEVCFGSAAVIGDRSADVSFGS